MADDEDEEDLSSQKLSLAKPHVPIAILSVALVALSWWSPLGTGPFWWFVWPLAVVAIAESAIVVLQIEIGSKRVGIGDTDDLTINQRATPVPIPAAYAPEGEMVHDEMVELRVGGKSKIVSTEGRHVAFFPAGDDVIEDSKRYMKIHADFGGTWYEWHELPPDLRERVAKVIDWGHGRRGDPDYRPPKAEPVPPGIVLEGPRRSHFYVAFKKKPRTAPKDRGSANEHATIKALGAKITFLEAQLRQSGYIAPPAAPPPVSPASPIGDLIR